MSALSRFAADAERHHAEQVAAGKHDRLCEWGPRIYGGERSPGTTFNHMCHCPKRRREAKGIVLPGGVEWNLPTCPECLAVLEGDGDSWNCPDCHVTWDSRGENAHWNDEYGDLGTAAS